MKARDLTDMLRGKRIIYARDVLKFSVALGLDVSELFQGSEESGEKSESRP